MSLHYRYRKQIIIGVILLFILVGGISFGVYQFQHKKKEKPKTSIVLSKKKEKKEVEEEVELLQVDIKGEVRTPGIYQVKESSRVMDVINIAGGLTENANTTVINLSKKIFDEMVIIIYSNQEVEDFKKTKEVEEQVINNCIQKEEN
ncbi:MAG: SLBB domain-containing protein, partial [Bacilli bacterium]|nr:SLBB domain-containing protein [Bacilli bacterium]